MAFSQRDKIIHGFRIIECQGYSHEIKKLEQKYPLIKRDIWAFFDEYLESLNPVSPFCSRRHVTHLSGYAAGFHEAKRVHAPTIGMGSRRGLRLVFRMDTEGMLIELAGIFLKGDRETWLPPSPKSGHRFHKHYSKGSMMNS